MKVKYDVTDAEVREDFKQPRPGLYPVKIHEVTAGDSKKGNPMLTIVLEVRSGEFKGSRVWHYMLIDGSQDWRVREFTDALGLKPKGALDTEALVGERLRARLVGEESNEYGYKARVKNLLADADDADDEEEDEEEAEEAEEDEPDEAEYSEWTLKELKEEAEERELEITGKATKAKLVAALEADDEEEEDDEEDEEEDDEEEEEYSEWDIADLKAELKERGLKTGGKKSLLITRLEKDDESDDEPF